MNITREALQTTALAGGEYQGPSVQAVLHFLDIRATLAAKETPVSLIAL